MYKTNQDTYARLFVHLLEGPASAHELAAEVGLHLVTVQSLMRCFHRYGLVHVAAWEPDSRGRDTTPIYAWGKGRDKARRKQTGTQRSLAYRERKQLRLAHAALTGTTGIAP